MQKLDLIGAAAFLIAFAAAPVWAGDVEPFDDCGVLAAGVEAGCVLFQADSGGRYLLAERGNFNVGDRVRVAGDRTTDCTSACMQGDGCILNNSISDCTNGVAACGELVSRNQCAILQSDDGQLYALDQYGGFGVGQRVHVVGDLEPSCGGECADGIACIRNNSIFDAARYANCDNGSVDTPEEPEEPGDEPLPELFFNLPQWSQGLCPAAGLGLVSLSLVGLRCSAARVRRPR